jgi:uncharacterized protein (TIGR00269 family)
VAGRRPRTRCGRCGTKAVIELRRHSVAFCGDCFKFYCRSSVTKAIEKYDMLREGDRVLVAVSGGKDSLALWDLLIQLGWRADGLYLGLGIGGYSDRSGQVCADFAAERGVELVRHDLAEEHGFSIPQAAPPKLRNGKLPPKGSGRSSCSVCGLSKRYVFNSTALAGGYDVVATGHNLDDEAAVLLGNTLHWDTASMSRQFPVLQATRPGLVKKVKPLYRLAERETAAYCVLSGIDYVVEECPLVAGNTQMRYKETLNEMEEAVPGTKHEFLFGYLEKAHHLLEAADDHELTACVQCGMVTQATTDGSEPVCAFCRTRARMAKRLELAETPAEAPAEAPAGAVTA